MGAVPPTPYRMRGNSKMLKYQLIDIGMEKQSLLRM